jgi:predicted nucleic acid-binding protein
MCEREQLAAAISARSVTVVYYIIKRQSDRSTAQRAVTGLLSLFEVVQVDQRLLEQAAASPFSDFEDSVQHQCAMRAGATRIITRDRSGFRQASMSVLSPSEYLRAAAR